MFTKPSLLFSCCLLLISCASTHILTRANQDGGRCSGPTHGGQLHGTWVCTFPNGSLRSETSYVLGKKTGPLKLYYENGQIESVSHWKNSFYDGVFTSYFPEGQKKFEMNFVEGIREGSFTEWYENGHIKTQGQFKNDIKIGIWNSFDPSGEPQPAESFPSR